MNEHGKWRRAARALGAAAVFATRSTAAAASGGPCPVTDGKPCVLTLEGPSGPSASPECGAAAWASRLKLTLPDRWVDSNHDGYFETVIEVRLDPTRDCGCARFRVFYDDAPTGFTVNLGNSPTNDGHGGDDGTTRSAAEVQILDRKLSLFTASREPLQRQVDKLFDQMLPSLRHRSVDLEVCDQALSFEVTPSPRDSGPTKWRLETLNSKLLFSLGPTGEDAASGAGRSVYVGFNRVIHRIGGAASHGRIGAGVRRVEVTLTP